MLAAGSVVVGVALQALSLIPGLPPALGFGLYAIFAGGMLIATTYDTTLASVSLDSVDASALTGVTVDAELYPPGKVWRPPAARTDQGRLMKLGEYVGQHEEAVHFTVTREADGDYDVALVVESKIREFGKAEVLAQWHAKDNGLPYR